MGEEGWAAGKDEAVIIAWHIYRDSAAPTRIYDEHTEQERETETERGQAGYSGRLRASHSQIVLHITLVFGRVCFQSDGYFLARNSFSQRRHESHLLCMYFIFPHWDSTSLLNEILNCPSHAWIRCSFPSSICLELLCLVSLVLSLVFSFTASIHPSMRPSLSPEKKKENNLIHGRVRADSRFPPRLHFLPPPPPPCPHLQHSLNLATFSSCCVCLSTLSPLRPVVLLFSYLLSLSISPFFILYYHANIPITSIISTNSTQDARSLAMR